MGWPDSRDGQPPGSPSTNNKLSIHNDQFSIPGILPLAVTLGLAAFISLTGALALIVVWSAMTAVMRHEDLHSAKTAIVRQIRYPDLDVVNPSRATTGTFGAHQG